MSFTPEFLERMNKALEDRVLQAALNKALTTVRRKSAASLMELTEPQDVRDVAAEVKRIAVNSLHRNLQELESRLEHAGTEVLWARNAEEATQHVTDIAREHNIQRAIFSKSMVAEEIELEHALQHAGVRVIQTDLGERVVQLAGQKPSHITAPCLHMSAKEIGKLLKVKTGMEYTDDPERISRYLAEQMRPTFLAAQMGISGVNMAVSRTGTLVMVENEGNVRLGYTLPEVHVAVLGIEKVVETMRDADFVLSLLARKATGQRSTSYLSLLGPGPLPGQKRYVVFVDNGRSFVFSKGPYRELLSCIRCGSCMNVCPVYEKVGGHAYGWTYPGPIGIALMHLMGPPEMASQANYLCSLCGACTEACPVEIPLDKLIVMGRARTNRLKPGKEYRRERRAFRLVTQSMLKGGRYRFTHWGHKVGRAVAPGVVRGVERKLGWHDQRTAPVPAKVLFRTRFKRRKKEPGGSS